MKVLTVILTFCAALPAEAATLHATPASLNATLTKARGGDTILLAPGTYAGWAPKGLSFSPAVTISSEDPGHRATFTNFDAHNIKGVTFQKLELRATAPGYFVFQLFNASDVHFDQVDVHGSLDGDPTDDAEGLRFVDSEDISVTNSEFHELKRAAAISTSNRVKVSGNIAHDLEVTGFMFAACTQVSVTDNAVWTLKSVPGDHADAIQFLTAGTTTPSRDITIARNLVYRGEGKATQGIFLRDQIGTLPYQDVTIADNLIVGTGYNGILVMGATHLSVTGNELISNPGSTNNTWIHLQATEDVQVEHNRAQMIGIDTSTKVAQKANQLIQPVKDGGRAALSAWAAVHPVMAPAIGLLIAK